MPLLELPLELFQLILCCAIQGRGTKRGVRLRLVNRKFDTEVINCLFIFRLLDAYFISNRVRRPPFAASYLEYRVLNESESGLPNLLLIRRIAQRLCRDFDGSIGGERLQTYVRQLSLAHVEKTRSYGLAQVFESKEPDMASFQNQIFVAAVCTQASPFIKQWIAEGRSIWVDSWLFGCASTYAVRHGNREFLAQAMLDSPYGFEYDYRSNLLRKSGFYGSLETTRYIFDFKNDTYPWCVSMDKRASKHAYAMGIVLVHFESPDTAIWDFILGKKRIYLDEQAHGQSYFTRALGMCAIRGWTAMVIHLLALGAQVDGKTPHSDSVPPLLHACRRGHENIVRVLLSNHASTTQAVEIASQYGHEAIVRVLLEHGADSTGGLRKAMEGGYRDVVELLLNHGADLDKELTLTSLTRIVESEHVPLFQLLLERGARFDKTTILKCMKTAEQQGLDSMMTCFVDYGQKIDM